MYFLNVFDAWSKNRAAKFKLQYKWIKTNKLTENVGFQLTDSGRVFMSNVGINRFVEVHNIQSRPITPLTYFTLDHTSQLCYHTLRDSSITRFLMLLLYLKGCSDRMHVRSAHAPASRGGSPDLSGIPTLWFGNPYIKIRAYNYN